MSNVSSFSFVLSGAWVASKNKWGDLSAGSQNVERFGLGWTFEDHLVPVFAQSPVQPDLELLEHLEPAMGHLQVLWAALPSAPLLPSSNRKARKVVLA